MSTVCERTGLGPSLLRAWERRYGLLRPGRTEGGHRLYGEDDLYVLGRVKALLDSGRTIGEVAAMGRDALLGPASTRPEQTGWVDAVGESKPGEGNGAGAPTLVRRLVSSAVRIDAAGADEALDVAFAALGPVGALDRVVVPALHEVGDAWGVGRCTSAGEHMLSAKVVGRLHALLGAASTPSPTARHAVCVGLAGDTHEIGALYAAFRAARHGYRVTYLGTDLPIGDLTRALEDLRPELVCISVTRIAVLESNREALLALARDRRAGMRVVLGGPGSSVAGAEFEDAGALVVGAGGPSFDEILG